MVKFVGLYIFCGEFFKGAVMLKINIRYFKTVCESLAYLNRNSVVSNPESKEEPQMSYKFTKNPHYSCLVENCCFLICIIPHIPLQVLYIGVLEGLVNGFCLRAMTQFSL